MRWLALGAASVVLFTFGFACGGSTSTQVKAALPLARGYHQMFSTTEGVLLFGGETAGPRLGGYVLGDVWIYKVGQGWTAKAGIGHKYGFVDGYDTKSHQLLSLVDSQEKFERITETRLYDQGSDKWSQQSSDGRPDIANGSMMAYDAESDRMIVFTGETWAYTVSTNTWQKMHPAKSPDFGNWGGFIYDERSDRILYLGGDKPAALSDVWKYDYNRDTWSEVNTPSGPDPRVYPGLAYDSRTGLIYLFGGAVGGEDPLGDTWAYDPTTNLWSELHPTRSPSSRSWHAMAYDVTSGKVVLFGGGHNRGAFKNETWIYDPVANNWAQG